MDLLLVLCKNQLSQKGLSKRQHAGNQCRNDMFCVRWHHLDNWCYSYEGKYYISD